MSVAMIATTTKSSTIVKAVLGRAEETGKQRPQLRLKGRVRINESSSWTPGRAFGRTAPVVAPPDRWGRQQNALRAESGSDFKVGPQARGPRRISHRHRATPTCDGVNITGPCVEMMSRTLVFREFAAATARGWLWDTLAALAIRRGRAR